MTEELKHRGRPRKNPISGAETVSEEWEHPPVQGHTEENSEESLETTISIECPTGYKTMDSAPKNCKIVVSETGEDQTCVYWRERRVVDRKNLRYIKRGDWTNDFTRMDIDFTPKFWRPYSSSDYFPSARVT